ncbi:MAG: DNA starvation/stationary phase protection protein [Chitinophagaceae bacterium]|nr:DNA starvation/stationary phase protection protein [Chitinophagaceae bacterium]
MKTNRIGLDAAISKKLADKLNTLLANFQIFYINSRGFHWNIKGEKFFELHVKFEELYTDVQLKVDEVAERILTLGHTPGHSYSEYLQHSAIQEKTNVTDGTEAVKSIVSSFGVLLEIERDLLRLSADAGDEGTNALMSDYIRQQEKLVWMYSAYLGK